MQYFIIEMVVDSVKRHCVSLLPKDVVQAKDIASRAIAGYLKTPKLTPEEFEENPAFKEFFHRVIARSLPSQPDFLNEGKNVSNGYVYVMDKRTKNPKGDVPMQDVIGAMNFENGNLLPESYLPNRNYRLVTSKGIFSLPYALEESLLNEIET